MGTFASAYHPRQGAAKRSRRVLDGVLLAVLATVLVLRATITTAVVDGPSMKPTLQPGEYLFVDKLYSEPKPGDLVLVRDWLDNHAIVKRVYRTEGQLVDWRNTPTYLSADKRIQPYYVPTGHVYLLGDNSRESEDSRYFGPVPVELIVGKVVLATRTPAVQTVAMR